MGWNKNRPLGTQTVSLADNDIRENNDALEASLDNEHQFTSADSSGIHKEGSARIYSDLAANIGAADSEEGRVYLETDTNKLKVTKAAGVWSQISPQHNFVRASWFPVADLLLDQVVWTEMTHAGLHAALTTTGGNILIQCTIGGIRVDTNDVVVMFVLYLDGAAVTAAANGMGAAPHIDGQSSPAENYRSLHLSWLATPVAAGAHTIELFYKLNNAGSAYALTQFGCNLVAMEM